MRYSIFSTRSPDGKGCGACGFNETLLYHISVLNRLVEKDLPRVLSELQRRLGNNCSLVVKDTTFETHIIEHVLRQRRVSDVVVWHCNVLNITWREGYCHEVECNVWAI